MPMTRPESPAASPRARGVRADGESIGLRPRIMAAAFGALAVAWGGYGSAMAVWTLADRGWDGARGHATPIPVFLFGLVMVWSSWRGRDLNARAVFGIVRGARFFG